MTSKPNSRPITRVSRIAGTLAALATAAALLVGCGDDPSATDKGPEPAALVDSAEAGDPAEGASEAPVSQVKEEVDADALTAVLAEAMQDKKSAHLEIRVPGVLTGSADVSYAGAETAMRMEMTTFGEQMTLVVVDQSLYVRKGEGDYLVIDKDAPMVADQLAKLADLGPSSAITALQDGLRKIELRGMRTIDGVEVRHYLGTVDTTAITDSLGGLGGTVVPGDLAGVTGDLTDKLPKTIGYHLYVDGDDLLRRMKTTVAGMTIQIDASAWGEPVTVEAPPASQTLEDLALGG